MRHLAPDEVALAASKVDAGASPDRRLNDLAAVIGQISRHFPVLAWQQGALGEACVAAGAIGYETGLGWRERCDLNAQMAGHRKEPSGGFGARPVYIAQLKKAVPKRSLAALIAETRLGPDLVCLDPHCCSNGIQSLLQDQRLHAFRARAVSLDRLASVSHPSWRWAHLARDANSGLDLAAKINARADALPTMTRFNTDALRAMAVLGQSRQRTGRRAA